MMRRICPRLVAGCGGNARSKLKQAPNMIPLFCIREILPDQPWMLFRFCCLDIDLADSLIYADWATALTLSAI